MGRVGKEWVKTKKWNGAVPFSVLSMCHHPRALLLSLPPFLSSGFSYLSLLFLIMSDIDFIYSQSYSHIPTSCNKYIYQILSKINKYIYQIIHQSIKLICLFEYNSVDIDIALYIQEHGFYTWHLTYLP